MESSGRSCRARQQPRGMREGGRGLLCQPRRGALQAGGCRAVPGGNRAWPWDGARIIPGDGVNPGDGVSPRTEQGSSHRPCPEPGTPCQRPGPRWWKCTKARAPSSRMQPAACRGRTRRAAEPRAAAWDGPRPAAGCAGTKGPRAGTVRQTPASGWSEHGLGAGRTLPARTLRAVGTQVSLLCPLGAGGGCRAPSTRPEGKPASERWSQERGRTFSGSCHPRTACLCPANPAVPRSLPLGPAKPGYGDRGWLCSWDPPSSLCGRSGWTRLCT